VPYFNKNPQNYILAGPPEEKKKFAMENFPCFEKSTMATTNYRGFLFFLFFKKELLLKYVHNLPRAAQILIWLILIYDVIFFLREKNIRSKERHVRQN